MVVQVARDVNVPRDGHGPRAYYDIARWPFLTDDAA
jgi:hypothetical protein